jgi:hypothetical protein
LEGLQLGELEGLQLGELEGLQLGELDGLQLGELDGLQLGELDGLQLGELEGLHEGEPPGLLLGEELLLPQRPQVCWQKLPESIHGWLQALKDFCIYTPRHPVRSPTLDVSCFTHLPAARCSFQDVFCPDLTDKAPLTTEPCKEAAQTAMTASERQASAAKTVRQEALILLDGILTINRK